MLSIIIPTLNEEKNLSLLLSSLKEEKGDWEIIIADAGSTDKTLKVAEDFGCIITEGGLPAEGRNKGALKARGDIFLFLDADLKLSPRFAKNSLEEFKARNLAVASFALLPIKNNFYLEPFLQFSSENLAKSISFGSNGYNGKKRYF